MMPIIGKSYITQGYGLTDFAQSHKSLYKAFGGIHPGIDFGTGGVNSECVSTVDGKVTFSGLSGGWGEYIEILGEDGWLRQYAHLSARFVKVGDIVKAADKIGRVGTTGASTGIHLHYGLRRKKLVGWEYRDPSVDFNKVKEAKIPKGNLIKGLSPTVYAFNGKIKFPIPDMETLTFLFKGAVIEDVSEDIVSKIPTGAILPSMK